MELKRALITGITGQDGSYLAELLLSKGYKVCGLKRRTSDLHYGNAEPIKNKIEFIYADMTDLTSLIQAVEKSQPDEVYNLAVQSFVQTSWEQPLLTGQVDAIGVTNILEAIRIVKPDARFYQASTSEIVKCLERYKKRPKGKQHHFIPEVLMEWQSSMGIGSPSIIEKAFICMLVQESYSTMNLPEEGWNL